MKLSTLSALLVLGASSANAAVMITNGFVGTTTTTQVTVGGLLTAGNSNTQTIGPGWTTTVNVGIGLAAYTRANMPGTGNFTVTSGGIAGVANSVVAQRRFSGQTVDSNTTYQISLGISDAALLSVLSGAGIQVGYTNGVTETIMTNAVTGTGLLGLADLVGLFGGGGTATFNVSSGTSVPAGSEIFVILQTANVATVLGSSFTFTGLGIQTVPEPSVALLGGLGILSFAMRRRRAA